jgi:magnesium-transporting ATPase (P-type)
MNDYEHRRKTHPEHYKRDWLFTIIAAVLAAAVLYGMISAWRHLAHDAYIVVTVLIPAGLVAFVLFIAAINGRRPVVKEALSDIINLFYWWP